MAKSSQLGVRRRSPRARLIFPHQLSWLLDNPLRRLFVSPDELARRLQLSDTSRVLEVGPGSGFFSAALARYVPRGELVLLDVQPQMLAKARRKLDAKGFHNVRYVAANAAGELPFPDGGFDAALLACVLGEVSDRRACLQSLRRVLRQSGLLCIYESMPDPDLINFETLKTLMHAEGFLFRGRCGNRWSYIAMFATPKLRFIAGDNRRKTDGPRPAS